MTRTLCLFATALALAGLFPVPAQAQSMAGETMPPAANTSLVEAVAGRQERGWEALARVLDILKPGVNTEPDPTPSEITDHIERLLSKGKAEQALQLVERRQTALAKQSCGTDVQLMFQHARALAALGRSDEAIVLYTDMTTRFPELPEPWNNLGALYATRGQWDKARDAVQMALRADANYAMARANLADLSRRLALLSQ
jgi:tetratricopeptide (TPR) repeat protein